MDDEACGTCYFYEPSEDDVGWCKRYPPASDLRVFKRKDDFQYVYSIEELGRRVSGEDWCGEFKERKGAA